MAQTIKPKPPLETDITESIRGWIRAHNGYSYKNFGVGYVEGRGGSAKPGFPDLTCIIDGITFFVEVKRPGGVVSEIQKKVHAEMKEAGGLVFVVHSIDELRECVYPLLPQRSFEGW